MKAKLIRSDLTVGKTFDPAHIEVKDGRRYAQEGTIIEDPRAYLLVKQGVAVPADEECAQAAGMSEDQMQKAQHAYGRVAAGIRPEDYELYDTGQITGYDPDGGYLPGPNWVEPELASGDMTEGGVYIP